MFKRTTYLTIMAMALVVFVSIPAWSAFDAFSNQIALNFSTKSMEELSRNTQIAQSGVLNKIKPLSLNYSSQLAQILLNVGIQGDGVTGAMDKALPVYCAELNDMFLGKGWDLCRAAFLNSWNYGGLSLNSTTKSNIDNLTRSHFQQIGQILTGIPGERTEYKEGFLKIDRTAGKIEGASGKH